MTTFDNKEKAEENKYAHDKEMEFLIFSRYNKILSVWVADVMGLDAAQAETYKNELVEASLGKIDKEALFKKVRHDLLVHDIHMSEHDIREKMYDLFQAARAQVMGEADKKG